MTDKIVQCPYVPSHQVRAGPKLQNHLNKCRRNTQGDSTSPFQKNALETEICQFDKTHHIHRDRMKHHIENECLAASEVHKTYLMDNADMNVPEWKKNISASANNEIPAWKKNINSSSHNDNSNRDDSSEDDWDAQPAGGTYDPQNKIANATKPLLLTPYGMTPSQRRLYRQENRKAVNGGIQNLPEDEADDASANFVPPEQPRRTNNVPKNEGPPKILQAANPVQETKTNAYAPLRRPNTVQPLGPVSTTHGRGQPLRSRESEISSVAQSMTGLGIGRGRGTRNINAPGFN